MTDVLSSKQRSRLMARIRGRDTKPEWILRSGLHRLGFRYRLGGAGLPGRPDLVLPRHRMAIFVHGCFWHRHPDCKRSSLPKTNAAFWRDKLDRNVQRDAENRRDLEAAGWKVITVWECELYRDPVRTTERVASRLTVWSEVGSGVPIRYADRVERLERTDLLSVAEKRVRYRLDNADLPSEQAHEGDA